MRTSMRIMPKVVKNLTLAKETIRKGNKLTKLLPLTGKKSLSNVVDHVVSTAYDAAIASQTMERDAK